jgi:hypothetical protein
MSASTNSGRLVQAIGATGEEIVARELRAKGYVNVTVDTSGPGSTDVVAHNPYGGGLLVQVKTCGLLGIPADLSPAERCAICARADRLGFEAWYTRSGRSSSSTTSALQCC